MVLRIWPKDFERKEHITKEEKALIKNAMKYFSAGHFAIGIDPVGMSTEKVRMGFYISPDCGLLTFSIYTDMVNLAMIDIYKNYVSMVEDKILTRLLDSKMLIVRNEECKFLKFPYRHAIIFANEKPDEMSTKDPSIQQLEYYAYAQFLSTMGKKKVEVVPAKFDVATGCRIKYYKDFECLSEQECRAIFERLAPEYTVVMHEKDLVEISQVKSTYNEQDFRITGKEQEYMTFWLDDYQVAHVNDMGKGHRLLLANPGAGKSVILLSKAFKYASLYKDSKVLLTCFNSNLADSYVFKRSCSNFGDNRNLYIMTFHKLVKKLFEECLKKRCKSNIASLEEIQECIDNVRSGQIKTRFKAIFIDEVQIFEPIYLELCYELLEKVEDATFLMAGDLNQTVRNQSRRGDAPWKRINGISLDFTGRVKYIEQNYRNSKQISDFLNRMLCYMNKYMEQFNMISKMEFDYDSFQPGKHNGLALKIKTGINRSKIQDAVILTVREIVENYKVGYSDIAILFPFKENKALNYYFMYWITSALDREDIPYSLITPPIDSGLSKVQYSKTTGIVISTIDSSLGLDFKAVIVAGLYPYNYCFTEKHKKILIETWSQVGELGQYEKEEFQVQMRKLYTACSRARDILYVLSDLIPNSPMEDILIESKEK